MYQKDDQSLRMYVLENPDVTVQVKESSGKEKMYKLLKNIVRYTGHLPPQGERRRKSAVFVPADFTAGGIPE